MDETSASGTRESHYPTCSSPPPPFLCLSLLCRRASGWVEWVVVTFRTLPQRVESARASHASSRVNRLCLISRSLIPTCAARVTDWSALDACKSCPCAQGKLSKGDRIAVTDHSQVAYEPFRKDFYVEAREVAAMSDTDVNALRRELEGIKIRGKDCPRPIRTWTQAGLHARVLEIVTQKLGYSRPMPIQAQALPAIMKGRDVIGIAKTGSGKTMAFVLPMLRHINDQPPLRDGDGPVALIMAPTRELVQQISKDVRRFTRVMKMDVVSVFGGSGVANQISELRRGA